MFLIITLNPIVVCFHPTKSGFKVKKPLFLEPLSYNIIYLAWSDPKSRRNNQDQGKEAAQIRGREGIKRCGELISN